MATKGLYIVGIISFYIILSLFLGYAGFEFEALGGFNFNTETTPTIDNSVSNITLGGFFSILLGVFSFSISGMPFVINIILWLPLIFMIVLIYELIRGV